MVVVTVMSVSVVETMVEVAVMCQCEDVYVGGRCGDDSDKT